LFLLHPPEILLLLALAAGALIILLVFHYPIFAAGSRSPTPTSPSFEGNLDTKPSCRASIAFSLVHDNFSSVKQQASAATAATPLNETVPQPDAASGSASVFSLSSLRNSLPSISLPSLSFPSESIPSFFSSGTNNSHVIPNTFCLKASSQTLQVLPLQPPQTAKANAGNGGLKYTFTPLQKLR
jgi:hypothetical protein